jgi:hypothetical protein
MLPDAPPLANDDDASMLEPDPIECSARLQLSGDHLSGEVRGPDGRTIVFSGWLGLIGAVESVRFLGPHTDGGEQE